MDNKVILGPTYNWLQLVGYGFSFSICNQFLFLSWSGAGSRPWSGVGIRPWSESKCVFVSRQKRKVLCREMAGPETYLMKKNMLHMPWYK